MWVTAFVDEKHISNDFSSDGQYLANLLGNAVLHSKFPDASWD